MTSLSINKEQLKAWALENILAVVFFSLAGLLFAWTNYRKNETYETEKEVAILSTKAKSIEKQLTTLRGIDGDLNALDGKLKILREDLLNFGRKTEIYRFFLDFEQTLGLKLGSPTIVRAYNFHQRTAITLDKDLSAYDGNLILVEYLINFKAPFYKLLGFIQALNSCQKYIGITKMELKEEGGASAGQSYDTSNSFGTTLLKPNEVEKSMEVTIYLTILGEIKFNESENE